MRNMNGIGWDDLGGENITNKKHVFCMYFLNSFSKVWRAQEFV
jgi:hypothetical protein